jgi:hypothetical protein
VELQTNVQLVLVEVFWMRLLQARVLALQAVIGLGNTPRVY